MHTLKDQHKLKPWLCGILRFKVSRFRRSQGSQAMQQAVAINHDIPLAANASNGDIAPPTEHSANPNINAVENHAIQAQEAQLLWQTLQQLPENYRVPLILFYREQCSVEAVAEALELNEATARQRLSRGRKLLQAAMLKFVERGLEASKPGAVFTFGVMAGVAELSPPAKAASVGVAAKAGGTFKFSALVVLLSSFCGVIAAFFSVRAALIRARTPAERQRLILTVFTFFAVALAYVAGMWLLRSLALNSPGEYRLGYFIGSQLLVVIFTACNILLLFKRVFNEGEFRVQQRKLHPQAFARPIDAPGAKQRDYRSRATLFGVPLLHVRLGIAEPGEAPAFAWVAGGERAYGLLFAWGSFAVAPISVGIFSVGFISFGVLALGILAVGTACAGIIGFGASAFGIQAFSSLSSLGWHSAISGGFAMANEAAIGPLAFAKQVNNNAAEAQANLNLFNTYYLWVLGLCSLVTIVPAVWYGNKIQQRFRQQRRP